jgi:mannitol/fructose-specific phosphotransferase system IIA component (Ntr-type)
MNKHINQLLQIQDMALALRENDILHQNRDVEASVSEGIKANIDKMKEALPSDTQYKMERLDSKGDLFVVPMINDVCHGCFMKIPVAIAHNVRNTTQCVNCPNCDRFLYEDYQIPRKDDDNAHYKGIARFSSVELMLPKLNSTGHADAIAEMAELTFKAGFVEEEKEFRDALLRREAVSSTAVGSGLAFPHARGVHAGGLTLAIGLSENGLDFGNGEKPKIVFASAVPAPASMFYMEMVSKIARYFAESERSEKLLACSTSEEMWKIIVKIGR